MLRIFSANEPEEWTTLLPDIEFAYNSRIHSAIKISPFFALMGYNPTAVPLAYPTTNFPGIEERLGNLQMARKEADAAMELARSHMAERITRKFHPFKLGQKVWLEGKHLNTGYPHKKFAPKREGPFVIKEILSRLTYRLDLPKRWEIHDVFHASVLSPYKETDEHGPNYSRPPPDVIEDHEEQEVEAIINHKKVRGKYQFYVTWLGFPSNENEWLPEEDLVNAPEVLKTYKERHGLD